MVKKDKNGNPGKEMALSGHLKELRNRILVVLACLVVSFLVCLNYASDIVRLLTDMGKEYGYTYVFIAPQELLMQNFSVALLASVCLTFPLIIYQLWAFASPGMKKKENVLFILAVVFGLICFIIGVFFAYKIMLPFMLRFLISVSTGTDIKASISVANYITFMLTIFTVFGVVFELPVMSVLLVNLGILKVEWMRKGTRVVIVLIFVLAAIITPPDIVSQIMVAIPMIGLYELSIVICAVLVKLKRRKKAEDGDEDEEDGDGDEDEGSAED